MAGEKEDWSQGVRFGEGSRLPGGKGGQGGGCLLPRLSR